ncbi:GNAT family N-acetyltransferase [Chondrinema litorale]|uniref:GNAT family N-acetyltransferase n=1 Tax=Chondrinema litorale TaxID=2994555 RepID=UPI0025435066|nr:GNAT family N-acetyltransferase [Chondrinema litorale]UZR99413.1 hypothetical protein OQ292_36120 [Chondrinema litorale]
MNIYKNRIQDHLAYALEYSETTYWSKLYSSHLNGLRSFSNVIAGAFTGALPEVDVLAMNRVLGLGMDRKIEQNDIQKIIDFYYKSGSKRFFVQVSPYAQQENLTELLAQNGLQLHNNWVKLVRPAHKVLLQNNPDLKLIKIGKEKAMLYGKIIFESFDWTDTRLMEWLAASVGQQGYHHYLVMHNDVAIAAGAMHIMGNFASMAFAGTLPEYRGMGAQNILLKKRISYALGLGCTYFIAETGEDKLEKPVPSYRNMMRIGFVPAYLRQNWIFQFN